MRIRFGWSLAAFAVIFALVFYPPIPLLLVFHGWLVGSMYGMPDETRDAVNYVGEEINVLRANNRHLGNMNTTEAWERIEINDRRIGALLLELERLSPRGATIFNGLFDRISPTYSAQPVDETLSAVDTHDYVHVGNRAIFFGNNELCSSGVVVKRTAADSSAEIGVLTNEHCGDAYDPVMFRWDNYAKAEKQGGVNYLCDCAFVRLGHEPIDSDTIWTEWGPLTISEYRDFEIGEWVEFHGKSGYSLGRVLVVADTFFFKTYVIDVKVVSGDSGRPFIGLNDRSFGGINSAGNDFSEKPTTSFGFAWSTVQQKLGVTRP